MVCKKILDDPERQWLKKQKEARSVNEIDSRRGPSKEADAASIISKESEEWMVAAIIRGVMQSSHEDANNSSRSIQQAVAGPKHGSRLNADGQSISSVRSGVTFDRSTNSGA